MVQIVCSQSNSFILFSEGHVYAMGSNDSWQCTELESMKNEENETVAESLLELDAEEQKWMSEID